MGAGVYYLVRLLRLRRFSLGFCLTLGLVIAGGLGNVIDCLFYGEIFSTSRGAVAQLVPWGEGYGTFLHGKVVDMLYFPIIQTTYPSWSPIHAGEQFIFFSPIFNFADACISVGVVLLLLCYRRTFSTALDTLFPSRIRIRLRRLIRRNSLVVLPYVVSLHPAPPQPTEGSLAGASPCRGECLRWL